MTGSSLSTVSGYPHTRLRRLRRTPELRALIRETHVRPESLIQPLFVSEELGDDEQQPIAAMPGVARHGIASAVEQARAAKEAGAGGVMLFGIPAHKDDRGSGAWSEDGVVQRAVATIAAEVTGLLVTTDVCLCDYTEHGHCGVVGPGPAAGVDNDATLPLLARTAVSHAAAGADIVFPSDMMDGRVGAIRAALDGAGHTDTVIAAHSAKFASSLYGPFRDAAGSAPAFGDRRGYQLDPANRAEAVREALLDVGEGADIVLVKPALMYLDVIAEVKQETGMPVAAYSVGGEYAMIRHGAAAGALDERATVLESLTAIGRAGADIVITYHAADAATWLQ